jgi:TRAP-type C4-dicarboxylate transport system permease small subunit
VAEPLEPPAQGLDRPILRLRQGLELLMALGLAGMVLLVFGNVVLRYAFDSSITVSEELSRWLFIWVTFLGAVVALQRHAHLGTDAFVEMLPPGGQRACRVVAGLLMLGTVALLLQGAWTQMKINAEVTAPSSGWPVSIVHAAAVVFAVLALALLVRGLWQDLSGKAPARAAAPEQTP